MSPHLHALEQSARAAAIEAWLSESVRPVAGDAGSRPLTLRYLPQRLRRRGRLEITDMDSGFLDIVTINSRKTVPAVQSEETVENECLAS